MGRFFIHLPPRTLWFFSTLCLSLLSTTPLAQSQIIPDSTLPNQTLVSPRGDTHFIEGGTTVGRNLFHSFQEFSILTGTEAYFNSAPNIENILSRVTGNTFSTIDGTLRTNGTTNLFLLNPNGIIFGPNARLEIGGSFVATTANAIQLGDEGFFSATAPEQSTLLSISPGALFFNQMANQQAAITTTGRLVVGRNLTLAADHLILQGQLEAGENLTLQARDTVRIRDSLTSPFIAKAGADLQLQGNQQVDIFALNHPKSGLFSGGNMVLRSPNAIIGDAHYYSGGDFRIEQSDGRLGNLFSPNDPVIRSLGDVSFFSYQGASLHIFAAGQVNIPGYVWIQGSDPVNGIIETITLSDGTTVAINGQTESTLDIRAGMNPAAVGSTGIDGTSGIFYPPPPTLTNVPTGADINIGEIYFFDAAGNPLPGTVLLTNQYNPNPTLPDGAIAVGLLYNSSNAGDAGNIAMDSRGAINLSGDTYTSSSGVVGNGGLIHLIAGGNITTRNLNSFSYNGNGGSISLISTNGTVNTSAGSVNAQTSGINGGDVRFTARGNITTSTLNTYSYIGNGGNVLLTSTEGAIDTSGGGVNAQTSGVNGGEVRFSARENITTGNIDTYSYNGVGGNISVNSTNGAINTTAGTLNTTANESGNVSLFAAQDIISGNILTYGTNRGGEIALHSEGSIAQNSSTFNSSTSGTQNGGSISLIAKGMITQMNSQVFSNTFGVGDAGNISLWAGNSIVQTNSLLSSSTTPNSAGDAGSITLIGNELIDQTQSQIVSNTVASSTGTAGNIFLITQGAINHNQSLLSTSTSNNRDAGNISIQARSLFLTNGSVLSSYTDGKLGRGGDIAIQVNAFTLSDRSQVSTSTYGTGVGGNLSIVAADTVTVTNNAQLLTESYGTQAAGNFSITTRDLNVLNQGNASVSNYGQGQGGILSINASNTVTLSNEGSLLARTTGAGDAGGIEIATRSLILTDEAQITASTTGAGDAGGVQINARENVALNHSLINTAIGAGATGDGGDINIINTRSLTLTNGAQLTASTEGTGDAGNINLQLWDSLTLDNNASISAFSEDGTGGTITINALNGVNLDQESQITSEATGNGSAGNLAIATDTLSVSDRSRVAVSSAGAGRSGNLTIEVGEIFLNQQGQLIASTASGEGGNIRLDVDESLLMRHLSLISADAGGTGNGGNLDINAQFVVAIPTENSDIVATAVGGRGGNININAQGVLGLEFREQLTPWSDITASSQFGIDGVVAINRPDVDPSQGLSELPETPTNPSEHIVTTCLADEGGSFAVTGRGGLPEDPTGLLRGRRIWRDLRPIEEDRTLPPASPVPLPHSHAPSPPPLIEATGWVIDSQGQVALVAHQPQENSLRPEQYPTECASTNPD